MAFQIVESTELSFTVNCDYPLARGETKGVALDMTAERPDTETTGDLLSAARMQDLKKVKSIMLDHVTGWTGFVGSDKAAIPYNEENLKQFVNDPALLLAAAAAFITASNGGAKAKNSKARRGGTQS